MSEESHEEDAEASSPQWWREPLAGILAVGLGVSDAWHFGRDGGLTASVDELLVLGGVVLIAGSRKLLSVSPGRRERPDDR